MKTPQDKQIIFTFASHPNKDPALRWAAMLEFPPGLSSSGDLLSLVVTDGYGKLIDCGVFEIASQRVDVKGGRGKMTYGDFLSGRHSASLWLHLPGKSPIPGGLTFG